MANRKKVSEIIADKSYVNCPVDVIDQRLEGHYDNGIGKQWNDPDYMLCSKGRTLHLTVTPQAMSARLAYPMIGKQRVTWDAALDEAEQMLRAAGANIVTALSGSETTEQAYALGKLLRDGLDAHVAVMSGQIFALAVMAVAASEVVVGLGLIVAVHRRRLELDVDKLSTLRG